MVPSRLDPCLALLLLVAVAGCPPLPPEVTTCADIEACDTSAADTTGEPTPTTGGGVHTATSDAADSSSGSTSANTEDTADDTTGGTTVNPDAPPAIVDGVVIPDVIEENGLLQVTVTTKHADGVRMALDGGAPLELTAVRADEYSGQIAAFTGFDNGEHTAVLTPMRGELAGAAVEADYVVALPTPGSAVHWDVEEFWNGDVAAIAVLPDGHPVEFGTYQTVDGPLCYLQQRDQQGKVDDIYFILEPANCKAVDLKIDRDHGVMHVLLERPTDDGTVWWAGEIPAWGVWPTNIGIGEVGDTAFALAVRPDVVAVCGARSVETDDGHDALAVLLRPGKPAQTRVFDYLPSKDPEMAHLFGESARDCVFADDKLVLVGEVNGKHEGVDSEERDRLMIIETTIVPIISKWIVAGIDDGLQTRATALDLDEQGRYHIAGTTCLDKCEPVAEVRIYQPGGKLDIRTSIGPLGSAWFGPHDIAWSPVGYDVVALGELDGQKFVFKVQAIAPGVIAPLWTFVPDVKQGLQFAVAVAVGPYGEVYAGGIADTDHAAFVRIGG